MGGHRDGRWHTTHRGQRHLDCRGVSRSQITERTDPFPNAVLVFRDPDNIQLELIWE